MIIFKISKVMITNHLGFIAFSQSTCSEGPPPQKLLLSVRGVCDVIRVPPRGRNMSSVLGDAISVPRVK